MTTPDPEFFAAGFGAYTNFAPLDVDPEINRVAALFAVFGAQAADAWTTSPEQRNGAAAQERLDAWVASGAAGSILYWLGHGVSNHQSSGLAHVGSPNDANQQGKLVTPDAFAQALHDRDRDESMRDNWALVLVDACQSARFIQEVSARLDELQGPRRVLLLASSPPGASATLGRLYKAVEAAIASVANVREVELLRLAKAIKRALDDGEWAVKNVEDVVLTNRRALPSGLQATVDDTDRLNRRRDDLPPDLADAAGREVSGADAEQLRFDVVASVFFCGRASEQQQIDDWMRSSDRLMIATGAAGSGKSALLGRVRLQGNPLFADHAVDAQPDAPQVTAAVRLTGATVDAVILALARRLQLGEPPAELDTERRVLWLQEALGRGAAPIVLLDALDEAADVMGIAALVERLTRGGQVRALVGTRASADAQWGDATTTGDEIIQRLGGGADDTRVLTVEADPSALADYVRKRLAAESASPLSADVIESVAATLATSPDFLFAHLAVLEVMASPDLLGTGWLEEVVAGGAAALVRRVVDRLRSRNPAYVPLLRALAGRRGRGLPIEDGVWLAAAAAFANGDVPDTGDLTALLHDAAPHLMVDAEFRTTTYRLAHRLFEDELLGSSS